MRGTRLQRRAVVASLAILANCGRVTPDTSSAHDGGRADSASRAPPGIADSGHPRRDARRTDSASHVESGTAETGPVRRDASQCGATGQPCCGGTICSTGTVCTSDVCCPAGRTVCDGGCVDEEEDPENCGGCGTACGTGRCTGGSCCTASPADCTYDVEGGCCISPCTETCCEPNGSQCNMNSDCCNGSCNGVDIAPVAICCNLSPLPCANDNDCCAGICNADAGRCCTPSGSVFSCASNADCCTGNCGAGNLCM
jgi:hypothetical protein